MFSHEITPSIQYSSAMDSVNLINNLLLKPSLNEEEKTRLKINVEHLEIMVSKDFWTTEDLLPLTEAIAAGKEV